MNMQKLETLPPPPNVIGSLKAGFDVVSNRLALIFLPLALDMFFWFGPRLSVNELLAPYLTPIFQEWIKNASTADINQFLQRQSIFMEWLADFNLLNLLSKSSVIGISPIGVISLSAQTLPTENPMGTQMVFGIPSLWILFGLMITLIPLGWVGGGIYFRQVASSILGEQDSGVSLMRAIFQTILLSILWLIAIAILLVPLVLIYTMFGLINILIANIVLLILLSLSFWLIVPMFFTPHGIFIRGQNAFYSIYSSIRMTRFSLPTSGMFVLSVFLLSRGLDILWSVPESGSWLAFVGFAGHAFISTALLAASFVYYRDMTNWLQNVYEKIQQMGNKPYANNRL